MSPARACALRVVRRVFEQGAYADRAFASESAALEPRERSLAMQIAYGTVQRRATLDHIARQLVHGGLDQLQPVVLASIRIALFQLLYLGGVPAHAAVDESVELAKRSAPQGAGLVNAVLRRAAREGPAILEQLDDASPEAAAILHSAPPWLAKRWWTELGPEDARALLRHSNEPAESALRVNLLVSEVRDVAPRLPGLAAPAPELPEGLVLNAPFDAHGSDLFREGAIMPQSRASMLVARVLAAASGEHALDLCAAPGAKTTHLAALMGDQGRIVAVEHHPGRARALERTCERMRTRCVEVQVKDAASAPPGAFDRVLVDPPCSGLGTLQSRPDLRWRVRPDAIEQLALLQARILAAGAAATQPGGALVYSVCTISQRESEEVVEAFLREHPDFGAEDLGSEYPDWRYERDPRYLQLLPHRDGTDGFFIARLRRDRGPITSSEQ